VFRKEKSKVLIIGNDTHTHFKLGNMDIEETSKYKYLGEMMNKKGNHEDHINMIEGKVERSSISNSLIYS